MNRRRRLRSLMAELARHDVTFKLEGNRAIIAGLTMDTWLSDWLERNQIHLVTILLRQRLPTTLPPAGGRDDAPPSGDIFEGEDLEALLDLFTTLEDHQAPGDPTEFRTDTLHSRLPAHSRDPLSQS